MNSSSKIDRKFIRDFNRAIMRSAFASVFAAVITAKKRDGGFTFSELAQKLGVGKSAVSRWFNRDVNWELNSVADIATALDVDLKITAVDRSTGRMFGPSGQYPTSVRTYSHGERDATPKSPSTTDGASRSIVIAA